MKLKDVIKLCAVYLGRERVVKYLEDGINISDEDVLSTVDALTRCANVVISELACTFFPLVKKEKTGAEGGRTYYVNLTETPLEIKNVYNDAGSKIPFEVLPEYVKTDETSVTIEYAYLPANYDLNSHIGYTESKVPSRVLAYGTTAEFCLTERSFDESVMWRKRFTDALSLMLKPKNSKIKQRSFN